MKRMILLIAVLYFSLTAGAQLFHTDSAFVSSDGGNTFQLSSVGNFYRDAANCRVAYAFSGTWDSVSHQLKNSNYQSLDYYSNGNLRQNTTQQWNPNSNTYVNYSRVSYTYYQSTDKKVSTLNEMWNQSAWRNSTLETNTYNANGYLTNNLNQNWDTLINGWKNTNETIYYNNSSGLADSSINVVYQNNTASNNYKTVYTYVAATSLVLQEIRQTYTNNQWQNSTRTMNNYTYDVNGNVTKMVALGDNYNSANNQWQNSVRTTTVYYPGGKPATIDVEIVSPITQSWTLSSRQTYIFNAEGNPIEQTSSIYSFFTGAITNVSKIRIRYEACTALPVTLLNVKAEQQKDNVLLSWITASENNSLYFDIQRSEYDNLHFVSIGRQNAAGYSSTSIGYHFIDTITSTNKVKYLFYRLRQVDKDGKLNYSSVVSLIIKNYAQINIVPNPAKSRITILHDNATDLTNSFISIIDISGKTVLRQKFQNTDIPISSFKKGTYIISLTTPAKTITRKFIIE